MLWPPKAGAGRPSRDATRPGTPGSLVRHSHRAVADHGVGLLARGGGVKGSESGDGGWCDAGDRLVEEKDRDVVGVFCPPIKKAVRLCWAGLSTLPLRDQKDPRRSRIDPPPGGSSGSSEPSGALVDASECPDSEFPSSTRSTDDLNGLTIDSADDQTMGSA